MHNSYIFITGFFGAPVTEAAQKLAFERNAQHIDLDAEIQRIDGRSVQRICMIMGEHEYRNQEYEALSGILAKADSGCTIIQCGDGILLDEMCRNLIEAHELIIVGGNLTADQLWENARTITNSCHAFMTLTDESKKRAAFDDLHERQKQLFAPYLVSR